MAGTTKYAAAFAALFLLGGLVNGCSSTPVPTAAGGRCSADGDCESGLQCVEYTSTPAGSCMVLGKQCSKNCMTDDDCTSVKSSFRCKAGCTAGVVVCQ